MKKVSIMAVLCAVAATAAHADFQATAPVNNSKGGFVGGAENIVTVQQVSELRDDVPVIVRGKIVQRTGDDKYLFEDGTGTMTVEIDDDEWHGQTVTPADTVKLYGEVDRGIFKTEIDVKRVEKLQ